MSSYKKKGGGGCKKNKSLGLSFYWRLFVSVTFQDGENIFCQISLFLVLVFEVGAFDFPIHGDSSGSMHFVWTVELPRNIGSCVRLMARFRVSVCDIFLYHKTSFNVYVKEKLFYLYLPVFTWGSIQTINLLKSLRSNIKYYNI